MTYAVFEDNLITGNELIDSQHRELFEKINGLLRVCEAGDGKEEAVQTLKYLADYTEFHFGAEEQFQDEIGYPGIAEHKKKHEEFRMTVKELFEKLEKDGGPTDAFVASVDKNVTEWLKFHIQGFDRSVAEYKNIRNNPDLL